MAGKAEDPKVAALQDARALNPRPEMVTAREFAESEFFDARDLVQVKYEMVRRVKHDGDSVSGAATAYGLSRPSWYAAASALDEHGLPGLVADRPGPRRAHKLTEEVLAHLRELLAANPALRPIDLVERVAERFGVRMHPRTIERALARADRPKSR